MSSNKTKPTATSVHLFLEELVPEEKKADSWALYQMMVRLTGAQRNSLGYFYYWLW